MHRAIIIDDEPMGIHTLKALIEQYTEGVKVVATATDPEKGIILIEDYKPDIVFLDINMPVINGFELLDRLNFKEFALVFTTAYKEYALKAIKNRAYDYLLKPIDAGELKNCIANIIHKPVALKTNNSFANIIELSVKNGIIFIKPQDIIRLEASGSYTNFYLVDQVKHMVSKNLKECEELLGPSYFYRCHSSHIVNLHKVVKMISTDGLFVQMSDGSRPEISRKNKESFLAKLKTI